MTTAAPPFTHDGLAGGTRYYYVVVAANSAGPGPTSGEVSALALVGTPAHASADGELGGIRLRWDEVPGATGYRVYWSATAPVDLGPANQLSPTGTGYLDDGLAAGTLRYYVVTALDADGESPPTAPFSAVVPQVGTVTARYPVNGADWNSYLANDGTSVFAAADAPCANTPGGYSTCLHGGEMRQAVVTGETSCDGIAAEDSLGALQWACVPGTAGSAPSVVSTGLQEGKFLSAFLDFDAVGWRSVSLRVRKDGHTVLVTPPATWWSNPVVLANSGGMLASAGSVYLVTAQPASAFTIAANRVALVVKPGLMVSGGSANAVVYGSSLSYAWMEGGIDARTSHEGVYVLYGRYVVLRGIDIHGPDSGTGSGVLYSGSNGKISYLRVAGGTGTMDGIQVSYSQDVTLSHVVVSQGGGIFVALSSRISGWDLTGIAGGSTYAQMGLQVHESQFSAFLATTAASNQNGLAITASDNTFWNVAAVGNAGDGIVAWVIPGHATERNQLVDIATLGNLGASVSFDQVSDSRVRGQLLVGSSPACSVSGGTAPGLIAATCTDSGADGSSSYSGQASDAILRTGKSAASAFVGRVTLDDPENASDNLGKALFSTVSDWIHFSSRYRAWGLDGTATVPFVAGPCGTGEICRIWDWSLRSADTVLRRTIGASPVLLSHAWATSVTPYLQSECDVIHRGSVPDGNACVSTFLAGAIEREGDGIGNDDGLCESGEVCIAAPNFGAYQGHGTLVDAGTVSVGGFTARLLQYEQNGY